MRKQQLKPGEERILAEGEHQGVTWQHYEKQVRGTIGLTVGYRLTFGGLTRTGMTAGQTPEQACEDWAAHVNGAEQRREAGEEAQRQAVGRAAHDMLARDRRHAWLYELGVTAIIEACKGANDGYIAPKDYRRIYAGGLTEAERESDWYQAALAKRGG